MKGRSPVGRPRKNWVYTLSADKILLKVDLGTNETAGHSGSIKCYVTPGHHV